ncbi:MAG: hypothetical protein WB764_28210 [Xanthobacteraceae bacterium]
MGNFPIYIFVAGFAVQLCVAAYFWIPVLSNFVAGVGWRDVFFLENLQGISFFDLDPALFNEEGQKYRERLMRIRPRLRICLLIWTFVFGPLLILIQRTYLA